MPAIELLAKPKKAINVLLKIRRSDAELVWSSKKSSASAQAGSPGQPVPESLEASL